MRAKRITVASRSGWNRLIDWWAMHRLRRVTVLDAPPWRHPWHCSPIWDGGGESFATSVVPGWCESPTGLPTPSLTTVARLAPGAEAAIEADPEERITAYLDEGGRLPIPQTIWRPVGTDAAGSTEVVPQELLDLGVLPPPTIRETESGLVTQVSGLATDRAQARLARACELVLEHGREVVSLTPVADERGTPTLRVDFARPNPRGPRLGLRREWPDELTPADPGYLPAGAAVIADEGIDRLRLATIYVVSPRGAPEGSAPDQGWTAWVRHHVTRNVAYEVIGPDSRILEPLRFPWLGQSLGLGAGGRIIDSLADDLRNRAAELDAILGGLRTRGRFVEF